MVEPGDIPAESSNIEPAVETIPEDG